MTALSLFLSLSFPTQALPPHKPLVDIELFIYISEVWQKFQNMGNTASWLWQNNTLIWVFLNITARSAVILNQKFTRSHLIEDFAIIFFMTLRFRKETWLYRPPLSESCCYCFKAFIDRWKKSFRKSQSLENIGYLSKFNILGGEGSLSNSPFS